MANLSTQPAELRFTVEIKRAETGKTETVEMVGHIKPGDFDQSHDQIMSNKQEHEQWR